MTKFESFLFILGTSLAAGDPGVGNSFVELYRKIKGKFKKYECI